jgi:hypothetical protein
LQTTFRHHLLPISGIYCCPEKSANVPARSQGFLEISPKLAATKVLYHVFPTFGKRFAEFFRESGIFLPACLLNSGDLALVGQLSEADTADAVVSQVSVGTAADLAAVIAAGRELRSSLLL